MYHSFLGFDPVRSATIGIGLICVILCLIIFVVVVRRFKGWYAYNVFVGAIGRQVFFGV